VPLNVPQKKQGILGFLWGVSFLTPHSVEGQVGGKELGLLSWKPVSRAAGVPDKWASQGFPVILGNSHKVFGLSWL
jgi:hypothetical protein